MRLDADFNVSLAGLDAELAKALKPLENLLRQASGNKNAKVMFSDAGVEFFEQTLATFNQRNNLGLSDSDLKRYKDLFAKATQAREAVNEAIKVGDSAAAVQRMLEMSESLQELFNSLAKVTENLEIQKKSFTAEANKVKTVIRDFQTKKTAAEGRPSVQSLLQSLQEFADALNNLDSKEASKLLGRQVSYKHIAKRINNFIALSAEPGQPVKIYNNDLNNLFKSLQAVFSDLETLEQKFNTRVAENARQLQAITEQFRTSQFDSLADVTRNAAISRGFKNAMGTGRANAQASLQGRAFSLLYGREPTSPDDDELFQNFVRTLGPTVESFQDQLYNIFSNTLGSLGAAIVFLTSRAIAETSADLQKLTQNLQAYQNILESRGESAKAEEIAVLRKELISLAGATDETVAKLSKALVDLTRMGASVEGFAQLVTRARIAFQQYGVDADALLEKSQEILVNQRRSFITPGMLAEIAALAGPQADKALENFEKLVSSQSGLILSYEELRDAALAYAKSGVEVSNSLAQNIEFAQKGKEMYGQLAAEADRAGTALTKNLLTLQDTEIFRAQQQVGVSIRESLLSSFDAVGLGQGSKSLLTIQTALLGLLTVVEKFLETAGGFLDWLNNLSVAGVRAGDLLRVVAALVAMTTALKALVFVGRLIGGQLMDTVKAWKMLGEAGSKTNLAKALDEVLASVSKLRLGLVGLGPVLVTLFNLIKTAFGPIGLAVTALTAIGAIAFQQDQLRKAEAAALRARSGDEYLVDSRGNSRFVQTGNSITYALGERSIDVTKALAELRNIDLAAAKIGISNADIENAQDLKTLYQVVRRYKEARDSFVNTQTADINNLKNRLQQTQKLLDEEQKKIEALAKENPEFKEFLTLRTKIKNKTISELELPRYGFLFDRYFKLIKPIIDLEIEASNIIDKINEKKSVLEASNTQARKLADTLVKAFEPITGILETIQNYDDVLKTVQLFEEYAIKQFKATTDLRTLDRFAQQEKQAEALIKVLRNQLSQEKNPVRQRQILEAIAEAQDSVIDAKVSRLRSLYALATDDVNTLPEGYTKLNESIYNIKTFVAGLSKEIKDARSRGATAEKLRTLEEDLQRAQNDLIQANKALTAYRVQLNKTKDSVLLSLENAVRPSTEFIADTSSFVYKLITQTSDILKQYENATVDEFGTVIPALLQRFDQLFSFALNTDLDRKMVDRYIDAAKAKKDEIQKVNALLGTFSANVNRLRNKSGASLSYLVEQTSKIFFDDGGVLSLLQGALEKVDNDLQDLQKTFTPSTETGLEDAITKFSDTGKYLINTLEAIRETQNQLPEIAKRFVEERRKQLEQLNQQIKNLESQIKSYRESLNNQRTKDPKSKNETLSKLVAAEREYKKLLELQPIYQKAFDSAGEDAVRYTTEILNDLQSRGRQLADLLLRSVKDFGIFIKNLSDDVKRQLDATFEVFAKYKIQPAYPRLEDVYKEIEKDAQNTERSLKQTNEAFNSFAYQKIVELDQLLVSIDPKYKELIQKLRQEKDPAKQNAIREALLERARQLGAELSNSTSDVNKALGAQISALLEALEILLDLRNTAKANLNKLPEEKELAKDAARARDYENRFSEEFNKGKDRIVSLLSKPSEDFDVNLQVVKQAQNITDSIEKNLQEIISALSADDNALKANPELKEKLQKQLEEFRDEFQQQVQQFAEKILNNYSQDIQDAVEKQSSQLYSEAEKEAARKRGLTALTNLQRLQEQLPQLGFSEREQRAIQDSIIKSIAESEKLFQKDIGNINLTPDNIEEVFQNILTMLKDKYGIVGELAKYIATKLLTEPVNELLEMLLGRFEKSTDEQLSNGNYTSLIQQLLDIRNFISLLSAKGFDVAQFNNRAEVQIKRVEENRLKDKQAQLEKEIDNLEKGTQFATITETIATRIKILDLINTALQDPEYNTERLRDLQNNQLERLQSLLTSSEFLKETLKNDLLKRWNSFDGTSKERSRALMNELISSFNLPADVVESILRRAEKAIPAMVEELLQQQSEALLKEFEFDSTIFEAKFKQDPQKALSEVNDLVNRFFQTQFARVKIAYDIFQEAVASGEDTTQAGIKLKDAAMNYIKTFRSFLDESIKLLKDAYESGQLSDSAYLQALKQLESLAANPLPLINQLQPLKDALGITEEEFRALVSSLLETAKAVKDARNIIEQTEEKLKILGDLTISKDERDYQTSALRVKQLLANDRPNSIDDEQIAEALRGLAQKYIEDRVKEYAESLPQNDKNRDAKITSFRNSLIARILSFPAQDLFNMLGLQATEEQIQKFGDILKAAIQDLSEKAKRVVSELEEEIQNLLSQLQDMLRAFFYDIFNIPTQMLEEARERGKRSQELQADIDLIRIQISEYEKLYQEAVANYGQMSEAASRYREKLLELRVEQQKLNEEFRRNEEGAKSFFTYLLEALGNFVKTFAQTVQQLIAQRLAIKTVSFISDLLGFGDNTTAGEFLKPGNGNIGVGSFSLQPNSNQPNAAITLVKGGIGMASNVATTSLSGAINSALGITGGIAGFVGPLAAGLAIGAITSVFTDLITRYSDLEQDHRLAGINRFVNDSINLNVPKRVEVYLNAQYDRQKLAQEAGKQVYVALGKDLID